MTQKEIMLYDQIVENDIATAEEINLVRNVTDGSWEEILNKICYARTGYRDLDQYFEAEMEEQRGNPLFFGRSAAGRQGSPRAEISLYHTSAVLSRGKLHKDLDNSLPKFVILLKITSSLCTKRISFFVQYFLKLLLTK